MLDRLHIFSEHFIYYKHIKEMKSDLILFIIIVTLKN